MIKKAVKNNAVELILVFIFSLLVTIASIASPSPDAITLNTKNFIEINGPINYQSMATAQKELWEAHKARKSSKQPIYIVINSPGGIIGAAQYFYQFARHIPNIKTVTIYAASAAHMITQLIESDRFIVENGTMMAHRASVALQGQFEDGEMESRLKWLKKSVREIEKKVADRLKITLKAYKEKVKDEWWFTAEDAVLHNSADSIIVLKCSNKLIETKKEITVHTMFGPQKYKKSACPLLL